LEEAVEGVGEVDIAVGRADDQIVEGVELTAKVVVDESYRVSIVASNW
jgi:hypothetical protein